MEEKEIKNTTMYSRVTLSVHSLGLLYQYKEMAQARALLSVQCMDNKVCRDKLCTNSESDKEGLVICTVPITRPQCTTSNIKM